MRGVTGRLGTPLAIFLAGLSSCETKEVRQHASA